MSARKRALAFILKALIKTRFLVNLRNLHKMIIFQSMSTPNITPISRMKHTQQAKTRGIFRIKNSTKSCQVVAKKTSKTSKISKISSCCGIVMSRKLPWHVSNKHCMPLSMQRNKLKWQNLEPFTLNTKLNLPKKELISLTKKLNKLKNGLKNFKSKPKMPMIR